MKTSANNILNGYWNNSICVVQWDVSLSGRKVSNYYIVAANLDLAEMQGVKPGNVHIECIVDDFGRLVRAAA